MKMTVSRLLAASVATLGFATASNAAVIISTPGVATVLDFESDIEGVNSIGIGSSVNNALGAVAEPGNWNGRSIFNTNRQGSLHSESNVVATANGFWNDPVRSDVSFGPIADTLNVGGPPASGGVAGQNSLGLRGTGNDASLTSYGVQASIDDTNDSVYYLLVQNNTGADATFDISASIYFEEGDGAIIGSLNYGYATGGAGTDTAAPGGMSFTAYGSGPSATVGDTFASLAGTMTGSTANVAAGDYLVLSFDPTVGTGVIVDDISITAVAVPEPASLALLGLGSLMMIRRKA